MTSNGKGETFLDSLCKKSGVSLAVLAEDLGFLEDMIEDVFEELQRSRTELTGQVSALQARNRNLEEYVHMVAHDLKEPLVVMAFTSNMITNVPKLTSEILNEYVLQMGLTAFEMKRIINNLLHFAEVSEAERPLEPVHMAEVVANVQNRLSHMIREQQAQIVLPQAWPEAIGYGPWIEEVWANYISNALKYGGRPPYVELGVSASSDDTLRFWVRDNGIGIPPAVCTHLFSSFTPFSRLSDLEHGLGLPIVLRIIEKLGGQVGVESEIGKGSLFYFTLPAAASYAL
jgi:signal transduction histidine kinase